MKEISKKTRLIFIISLLVLIILVGSFLISGIDRYEVKIDSDNWINAATLKVASYVLPRLSPGEHVILVRAYDKAENHTEDEIKVIIAPVASPKITEYPGNIISPGEKLTLKGTAVSNATVEIHLEKKGQTPVIFNAAADKDGHWEVTYENIIQSGAYEVWAKQILDTGAESLSSNTVYIGVNSWLWRALQWLKNIGGLVIAILIFLVAVLAGRILLLAQVQNVADKIASGSS